MKHFWNQTVELRAFIISSFVTFVAFMGTLFLFWFQHYEIPLAILLGGVIVILSWLVLLLVKKKGKAQIKLDIFAIYLRFALVVLFVLLFVILQITLGVVVISPLYLLISYLVVSLLTLFAFHRKDA